jgi:uncharacterized protein YukJ
MDKLDLLSSEVFKVKDCEHQFICIAGSVFRFLPSGRIIAPIHMEHFDDLSFRTEIELWQDGGCWVDYLDCSIVTVRKELKMFLV